MKKQKEIKEKGGSLADTLKKIRKQFGEGSIIMLDDKPHVNIGAVPTGSIGLNYALGIGGFPKGRIIEIYGTESSGKTTLALHVIAEAQKIGMVCAFVDAEHGLDPQYAERLGVKTKDLIVSQPDGGEEALNITASLIDSHKVGVVVIDSVAALTPRSEIEGEIGATQIGTQAKLMSQALRMMAAPAAKSGTVVIFINQIRMNIGTYGNPETTAGGKALKFYSSVRCDVRRIAAIKKADEIIGSRVRVKVVKNKVASPFKLTEFDILYNEGIAHEGELLTLGEKFGIIAKNGAMYKYGDITLGRGYDTARTFLKENKPEAEKLEAEISAKCVE